MQQQTGTVEVKFNVMKADRGAVDVGMPKLIKAMKTAPRATINVLPRI